MEHVTGKGSIQRQIHLSLFLHQTDTKDDMGLLISVGR